jgi:tetratricopeptide (TPR) repeat protein
MVLTEALQIDPQQSYGLTARGIASMLVGEYEEAIMDFTTAMKINPEDEWALWHLGEALYCAHRSKEGKQVWSRWLELAKREWQDKPTLPHDWDNYRYALASLVNENLAEAEFHLKNAIERVNLRVSRGVEYLEINLPLYLLVSGQTEAACQHYQRLLRFQPSQAILDDVMHNFRILQGTGLAIAGLHDMLQLIRAHSSKEE